MGFLAIFFTKWLIFYGKFIPIASMYGIFTYIYHKNQPNADKYTIHGWYGIFFLSLNNIPFERYHDPVLQLRKMLAAPRSDELTLVIWLRYRLTQVQSMNGVFTYMKTPYSYP